jgi:hypothetical protein
MVRFPRTTANDADSSAIFQPGESTVSPRGAGALADQGVHPMLNDRPYPAPRKAKRSALEIEEERAWVRFYRQVGQADIAAEVLAQLDADAQARHDHLALYLSCRESLRAHKARTQRNKRIGQFVRQAGHVLVVVPLRALRLKSSRAIDLLVECLPEMRREPAAAKLRQLRRDAEVAQAHAAFEPKAPPSSASDAMAPIPIAARIA